MDAMTKAVAAGAAGAATTTVLHEVTRHLVPDAPRVDLLGMQGISRAARAAGTEGPHGAALFVTTMAADLVSNSLYYAGVGLAPRRRAVPLALLLGAVAGIGAVVLPKPLGFSDVTTNRTARTRLLAAALYTLGGLACGLTYRGLCEPDG
jgi:hypothetical protein